MQMQIMSAICAEYRLCEHQSQHNINSLFYRNDFAKPYF